MSEPQHDGKVTEDTVIGSISFKNELSIPNSKLKAAFIPIRISDLSLEYRSKLLAPQEDKWEKLKEKLKKSPIYITPIQVLFAMSLLESKLSALPGEPKEKT